MWLVMSEALCFLKIDQSNAYSGESKIQPNFALDNVRAAARAVAADEVNNW